MSPNQPHNYREAVGLAALKKLLSMVVIGATVALGALFVYLGDKYKIQALFVLTGMVALVGLGILFLSVPAVIERMRENKALLLSEAIRHTWYSYLAMAAFLPVVGPLFARFVEKKKNPFTQSAE